MLLTSSSFTPLKLWRGRKLKIAAVTGVVTVDNSHVTTTDIGTSNGVTHVIDAVLFPSSRKRTATDS